ncbi:hypothetical protein RGUI_2218 [Rhodovulum sp. P5]|nr:hypothetical protein RGUI_2218 [Rhodovulum sp. P5]
MKSAALSIALTAAAAVSASAASVTVVADVNTAGKAVNDALYLNVLDSATSVLFSRNEEQQSDTRALFNAQAGVSAVEDASTLTDALLAGVDLLVITRFYNNAIDYTAAEIASVANFVSDGGDVLVILEATAGSSLYSAYNSLLTGIGSAIQYTTGRTVMPFTDASLEDTDISDSSMSFAVDAYAHLSGGDAVAMDDTGAVFVAYEDIEDGPVVPLPGALPLMAAGGLALVGLKRRRTKR